MYARSVICTSDCVTQIGDQQDNGLVTPKVSSLFTEAWITVSVDEKPPISACFLKGFPHTSGEQVQRQNTSEGLRTDWLWGAVPPKSAPAAGLVAPKGQIVHQLVQRAASRGWDKTGLHVFTTADFTQPAASTSDVLHVTGIAGWAASTDYIMGDRVIVGTGVYEAEADGQSDSTGSGPTGAGSGIVDGTGGLTWKYIADWFAEGDVIYMGIGCLYTVGAVTGTDLTVTNTDLPAALVHVGA